MNQRFERPVDAKPWTYGFVEHATRRRRRGIIDAVAVGVLAFSAVFVIGMAFTNRYDLPRFYPTCGWARQVGATPISRDEKGYRQELDSDNDGLACEAYQDF